MLQVLQLSFAAAQQQSWSSSCYTALHALSPCPVSNPGTMGGCCLAFQPTHGGAHGRKTVDSQPASQMRCAWAQADRRTTKKSESSWTPSSGDLKRAMSFHGREAGAMGPWAHRKVLWPPPPCFPQPRVSHRTAGPPRAQKPPGLRAKPLSQVAVLVCSQVPRSQDPLVTAATMCPRVRPASVQNMSYTDESSFHPVTNTPWPNTTCFSLMMIHLILNPSNQLCLPYMLGLSTSKPMQRACAC